MSNKKKYECPICGHVNTDDMGLTIVVGEDGENAKIPHLVYCHECDVEFDGRIEGKLSDDQVAAILGEGAGE